jgi:hypothetical protein
MNPTLITILQGDFGMNLNFSLQDSQGAVFSLVNATSVLFRAQLAGLDEVKFASAMTIDSPTLGTCHYTPVATDFDSPGTYDVQLQVLFGTAQTVTFDNIQLQVLPRVPFT